MPVMIGRAEEGAAPERVSKLEQEVRRLNREVETLREQMDSEGGRSSYLAWATTAMAAFGALLGLLAMFRR